VHAACLFASFLEKDAIRVYSFEKMMVELFVA
jgi:hypothetical protein